MRQLADRTRWIIVALAAAITLVNAAKPVHVDDWCSVIDAREFAAHPAKPYAFEYDYTPYASNANSILLPPVLPYCLGIAAVAGYFDPFSLKLMLFPFIYLLLTALRSLLAWSGCPHPLLFALVFTLGPGVFPGMNCMLDVPALALELAAIHLILTAIRKESWILAVTAGIVAGAGVETKYTAAAAIPVMIFAGFCFGRVRYGILAALVAASAFVGVEAWLASVHGQSHFMAALSIRSGSTFKRIAQLAMPTFSLLGIVAFVPATLILHSIGRRRTANTLILLAILTPAILAFVPAPWQVWNPSPSPYNARFALSNALFVVLEVLCLDALRRCGLFRNAGAIDRFFLGWLVIETASMFVLSPFPAVRRCMGMGAAFTVLAGRVAGRNPAIAQRRAALIACTGIGLGLAYQVIDWTDAAALKQSAIGAVENARGRTPGRTVWSFGWSELYFYSREAGAVPFCWNGPQPAVGDLLVTWETDFMLEPLRFFPSAGVELLETVPMEMQGRLTLGSEYYAGCLPLSRRFGPQPCARIYRVTGPLTKPTP